VGSPSPTHAIQGGAALVVMADLGPDFAERLHHTAAALGLKLVPAQ
jgi:hypothetical protein